MGSRGSFMIAILQFWKDYGGPSIIKPFMDDSDCVMSMTIVHWNHGIFGAAQGWHKNRILYFSLSHYNIKAVFRL